MSTSFKCQNLDCRAQIVDGVETGKCVEGRELEACSFLRGDPNTTDSKERDNKDNQESISEITSELFLHHGEKLPVDEASNFCKKGNSRVIAIIGPSGSGKTSLIAALYTLFLTGPVKTVLFAGSSTLFAFEQACHTIRAECKQNAPYMPHTEHTTLPMGVSFYHLALKESSKDLVHLVIGDRTGEDYANAPDEPMIATKEFVEVRNASSVVLLVDGDGLRKSSSRESTRVKIFHILRVLVDCSVTNASQQLVFVLTKLDAILEMDEGGNKTLHAFVKLVQDVESMYANNFSKILSIQIAASPKSKILDFAHNVDVLLGHWLQERESPIWPDSYVRTNSLRSMGKFVNGTN